MKKISFLIIVILGFSQITVCQTVDSIKVEQAGEMIKVHYKILNSNSYQVFRVTVFCSINGGLKSELKSLSGDFGENVVGGRIDYLVLWDVLKDVDEVNSVDFSVRAELISDNTPRNSKKDKKDKIYKHNFNIMASAQLPGPGFGIRAGYMGKIGFSLHYIVGKAILIPNSGYPDRPDLKRLTFDFTGRIINKESFQMHLMAGTTAGQTIIENAGHIKWVPGGDFGFAFYMRKVTFALTSSFTYVGLAEQDPALNKHTFLDLSFGLRF